MISFGTALKLLIKRGLAVKCRISRAEFWWSYLAIFLAMIVDYVFIIIAAVMADSVPVVGLILLLVFGLAAIALVVLWVILSIRRVHDLDMSGWWVLFMLLPYFGSTIVLGMCLVKGTPGANRFGPDPYAPGVIDDILAQHKPMPQPQNFQQGYAQPGVQPQGFPQQQGYAQQGFNQGYQQPAANQQPGFAQPQTYVQPNGTQPQDFVPPQAAPQPELTAAPQVPAADASFQRSESQPNNQQQ